MEEQTLMTVSGSSLCVFDEHGELIGTIFRPLARNPLGPGRETVYLARPAESVTRPTAVAA